MRHEVYLFALSDENVPQEWIEKLTPFCAGIQIHHLKKWKIALRMMAGIISGKPFQLLYHYEKAAASKIKIYASKVQAGRIIFMLLRTVGYASLFKPGDCIIDLMDCFSYHYLLRSKNAGIIENRFFKTEYKRIKNFESFILSTHHKVSIISKKDKLLLPADNLKVIVVPNGVIIPPNSNDPKTIDVLFAGNLGYPPNIKASIFLCEEIFPVLSHYLPGIRMVIAGAFPGNKINLLQRSGITVIANVDDMFYLKKSSKIFIAPLFLSTGIQNKILEAMACNIPVLTTPQAAEAIGAMPEIHLFTAVSALEFAQKAQKILQMPQNEISAICNNALQLISENFNWEKNTLIFERLLY
jgi:polysaccharide biosynthesis protein PslH